ncbi:transposase [Spirosoma luteolum]
MKKTKFTEAQIVFALRQADTGTVVAEVCRKMGISEATFYNWIGSPKRKEIWRTRGSRTSSASSARRREPATEAVSS